MLVYHLQIIGDVAKYKKELAGSKYFFLNYLHMQRELKIISPTRDFVPPYPLPVLPIIRNLPWIIFYLLTNDIS